MKSKMKSAFALIAVALMIMVAIVPMVGLLTSDSDAALPDDSAVVDPAIEGKVKISGKLYDSANTSIATTGTNVIKLQYTAGTTYVSTTTATAADGYVFYVQENSISNVTISYVDEDGVAIPGYSVLSYTKLDSGEYTADIKSGYKTSTVTMYFASANNGSSVVSTVTVASIIGNKLEGSFTVSVDGTVKSELSGTFDKYGVATVYYPSSATSVKLATVTTSVSGISFTKEGGYDVSLTGATSLLTDQYLVTIKAPATVIAKMTVDAVAKASESTAQGFVILKNEVKYNATEASAKKAYFTYTPAKDDNGNPVVETSVKVTLKATNGTSRQITFTITSLVVTTSLDAATHSVYGELKMGSLHQEGKLKISTAEETPVSAGADADVEKDGAFLTFPDVGWNADTTVKQLKFAFGDFTIPNSTNFSFGNALTVAITSTDFVQITGYMYIGSGTTVALSGKSFTVTGSEVFGTLITGTDGKFEFLVAKNTDITIKPVDADTVTYTGTLTIGVKESPIASGVAINMGTQNVKIKVQNNLGKSIADVASCIKFIDENEDAIVHIGTDDYDEDTGIYTIAVRQDVSASGMKVYIDYTTTVTTLDPYVFSNYSVATAVAFTDGMAVKATNGDYALTFYSVAGNALAADTSYLTIKLAKVYKNSLGSIVYEGATDVVKKTVTTPKYEFRADGEKMLIDESSISTTPVVAYVAFLDITKALYTGNIFSKAYLLTADSKGNVKITADVDSFSATLTRLDKTTPISGIKVELGTVSGNTFTPIANKVTYTQNDGSFEFTSDSKFTDASAVRFDNDHNSGYDFNGSDLILDEDGYKVDSFKSKKDLYVATFVNADGSAIDITNIGTKTVGGNAVAVMPGFKDMGTFTAAWTSTTKDVAVVLSGYTVKDHTVTAEERSTGLITIESEQSKYSFVVADANDNPIQNARVTIWSYYGEIPVATTTYADTNVYGVASILLPIATNAAADRDTPYAFVVSAQTANTYTFATEPTEITDALTLVEADNAITKVYYGDAAGEYITVTPANTTVKVYVDEIEVTTAANVDKSDAGYFTYYGDPEIDYEFEVVDATAGYQYSFVKYAEAVDGMLNAREETVYGCVTDAAGASIGNTAAMTITPHYAASYHGKINTGNFAANGTYYTINVSKEDVLYYTVAFAGADEKKDLYTFEDSLSPYIFANEQKVEFSAVTANGVELAKAGEGEHATFAHAAAYDENGKKISKGEFADYVIVDVEDVDYFTADVTYSVANKYTFDKESLLPIFVANESIIAGTVPYTGGAAAGAVRLDLYLGEDLVKSVAGTISADKYNYTAILDLSDYIVDGVAFDSIIAVYSEGGVIIGASAVDPFTQVNDIVSPVAQQFIAELVAPSAIIALHVDIAQVGNTATVTADGKFIVADDESIYTDGQYIYTFAGWYVDNEKVSANPVFTFTMTDNVIISPQYTVTYEKTSDVNKDVEKEYVNIVEKVEVPVEKTVGIDTNVLIIGICAVIVALIAVVYAVIKKD